MTKTEFLALPLASQLGALYDAVLTPPPEPPRYDTALYSRDGAAYASECSPKQLQWHLARAEASVASGGQYADKDAKLAKALGYWLAWRSAYPAALWQGKRGDSQVTAAAPSDRPTVYPRQPAPEQRRADDGDSIPF